MKICNLNYLKSLSPGNPKLEIEIIELFLKQTPISITAMNECFSNSDWAGVQFNAHKIGSKFDFIGISKEYKEISLKIEKYAKNKENFDLMPNLFLEIESAFKKANTELQEELDKIITY